MSEVHAPYSLEFQQLRHLVQTVLVQAAADARELAERTGTPLVVRETGEHQAQVVSNRRPAKGAKAAKHPLANPVFLPYIPP
jgi:hypothetical protein